MHNSIDQSLYEEIGGERSIKAAVEILYGKIMRDPKLANFFNGVNIPMMRHHMEIFLAYAFGAEDAYKGRGLRESHKKLVEEKGLNDTHFDLVADHMVLTLVRLKIPDGIITNAMNILETTRNDVLNR